jgi:hypothetical protein
MMGVLVAAVAVAGCGGESEEPAAPEAPAAAPAQPAAKQPRPAGPGAQEVVTSDELPTNFPDDLPRYPGAEVKNSRTTGKVGMSVLMTSSDPVDQVSQFLADALAGEGWSTEIREAPKGTTILADKGDRTAVTEIRSAKNGSTRILVVVSQFGR